MTLTLDAMAPKSRSNASGRIKGDSPKGQASRDGWPTVVRRPALLSGTQTAAGRMLNI